MAILRQIAQLGQPVLRRPGEPVSDPADAAVQALIKDMLATVADANGVGIAAPQIFESRRLFIISSRPSPRYPHAPALPPTIIINPEIVGRSAELDKDWEGCLSIPGLRGLVPRHRRIEATWTDGAGRAHQGELSGFPARVFQHEYDHINGTLFVDRIESGLDLVTEKEYLRLVVAP